MITLEAVRAAVLSDVPWSRLDDLVRGELAAGRRVNDVFDAFHPFTDAVLDTPGLTPDGEDAFGDTLDALTGNCHSDHCYADTPATQPANGSAASHQPEGRDLGTPPRV